MSEPTATRLLALAGEDDAAGAQPGVRAKVDALRRFLLLYAATRSWLWVAVNHELDAGVLVAAAVALSACAALSVVPRYAAWAPRLALPVLLAQLWLTLR